MKERGRPDLPDCDPDSSSIDGGHSSEDEQRRSSTIKHSPWSDIDEKRLLAYKRTSLGSGSSPSSSPGLGPHLIRTRWNMVRPRVE
jgi:hypothetical protein